MRTLPGSGGGVGGIANLPYAYLSLKQRTKWATLAKKIQLVGLAEAAEIVGVAPSTLAMRRASARSEALPKPLADHVRPGQPSAFSRRREQANGSRPDSGPTRLDGYPLFGSFYAMFACPAYRRPHAGVTRRLLPGRGPSPQGGPLLLFAPYRAAGLGEPEGRRHHTLSRASAWISSVSCFLYRWKRAHAYSTSCSRVQIGPQASTAIGSGKRFQRERCR